MNKSNAVVATWLAIVCATVFAMIVVGGVTRLTGSGLSMVDWQPIMGVIPPLNEAEWQEAFDAYKQYPEYLQVNRGMALDEFKSIFFWEYSHRVLGRLIGVMFFFPLVIFWALGRIESRFKLKLVMALALGGMQGLLGWYMVKRGLIDIPRVSHFRLASHLLLAMFIFSFLAWLVLDLRGTRRVSVSIGYRRFILVFSSLLLLQILYGAFTAGLRAGFGYNTFPLMNGQFMADAVFFMQPWWLNLFESGATVQFVHRWLGALVVILAFAGWLMSRRFGGAAKWAAVLVLSTILIQFGIGVLTLLHVVPVGLGSLHQGWACIVLLAMVHQLYITRPE